jgi:pSer/pThr/pTyr-binding forkhead associated (FHA) protein
MAIELRILTGARSGYRERFDQRTIALGRHASSDLRFDPDADLDVSVRHAEILAQTSGYHLRDSGSTNGTFLNGRRISAEESLTDADVIWLGAEGPQVQVRIVQPGAARGDPSVAILVRQPTESWLHRLLAKLTGRS